MDAGLGGWKGLMVISILRSKNPVYVSQTHFIDMGTIEFFTNSPEYKNANIANFILAVPSERNWTNEDCNRGMIY